MLRAPTQDLHAQTISAEPQVISGEPGAIGFGQPGDLNVNTPAGATHTEPDSTPGEENDPKANAPVYPEGTGPDVLLVEREPLGRM